SRLPGCSRRQTSACSVARRSRASSLRSSTSREGFSLLRRPQYERGITVDVFALEQERKNDFSAATVRAWLDGAGRRSVSAARKRRRSGGSTSRRSRRQ